MHGKARSQSLAVWLCTGSSLVELGRHCSDAGTGFGSLHNGVCCPGHFRQQLLQFETLRLVTKSSFLLEQTHQFANRITLEKRRARSHITKRDGGMPLASHVSATCSKHAEQPMAQMATTDYLAVDNTCPLTDHFKRRVSAQPSSAPVLM